MELPVLLDSSFYSTQCTVCFTYLHSVYRRSFCFYFTQRTRFSTLPTYIPAMYHGTHHSMASKVYNNPGGEPASTSNGSCLGRVPYGSLLALGMCCIGAGLFCAMTYQGVHTTIKQAQELLNVSFEWLDKVHITFIVVGVLMAFISLLLLVVAALGTGETRRTVYRSWTARLGGRISCAVFLGVAYLLHICWIVVCVITGCALLLYSLVWDFCINQGGDRATEATCLNLSLLNGLLSRQQPDRSLDSLTLCGESLQKFCALSHQALPMYSMALLGSILVILGLVHHMICLAANYAHIKDEVKYVEFTEIANEYAAGGGIYGQSFYDQRV